MRDLPGEEGSLRAKVRNYAAMIETGRKLGVKPDQKLATGFALSKDVFTDQVDKVCALAATVKDAGT